MNQEWKGDFLGFSFAGTHSDDYNIVRTSNGDRFDENLHPEINDVTAEVPGMDGNYYFGSTFKNKPFSISFAFDHLSEKGFREMRAWLGTKTIQPLIFDERPYKKYLAKIENPVEMSYVCFDERRRVVDTERNGVRREGYEEEETSTVENVDVLAGETLVYVLEQEAITGSWYIEDEEQLPIEYSFEDNMFTFTNLSDTDINIKIHYNYLVQVPQWEQVTPYRYLEGTERVYKGEGTINFVCYYPFAKSVFKKLEGSDINSDWAASSRILDATTYATRHIDEYTDTPGIIRVYNAGDIQTGFRLYIPNTISSTITLTYSATGAKLVIKPWTLKSGDNGVIINTDNQLIQGVSIAPTVSNSYSYQTSKNIYNNYIQSGYFFKLNPNALNTTNTISINGGIDDSNPPLIFYDYLYF